jgi:hypothetical protein
LRMASAAFSVASGTAAHSWSRLAASNMTEAGAACATDEQDITERLAADCGRGAKEGILVHTKCETKNSIFCEYVMYLEKTECVV